MKELTRGEKTRLRNIQKYGSLEAYRAEMKRRRSFGVNASKVDTALLKKYYREGLTQAEIAEKFGTSQPHISRLVRKHCR